MIYVIVVVVILAAAIAYAVKASKSSDAARDGVASESDGSGDTGSVGATLAGPAVSAFHVRGETASTVFDVPLGAAEAGAHLVDLLSSAAVEHVRAKSSEGLPLDEVHRIEVSAMRSGQPEVIGTVELPSPGQLPEPSTSLSSAGPAGGLIAALNEVVADTSVSSQPSTKGSLDSVAEFVQLTGPSEARLRAVGVDPSTMSLMDLTLGLFRVGGYTVDADGKNLATAPDAAVHNASKPGERLALVVFAHKEGDYPEIDERVFGELAVLAGQSNAQRTLLVSDKFGPYSMYERERRNKRLVCVTRERLQAFVDSFGLG